VTRYTFVVQVHPEGISTLENLSTRERVQVPDLPAVGRQIEEWLESLPRTDQATTANPAPHPLEPETTA
jgi:hypothetical protein